LGKQEVQSDKMLSDASILPAVSRFEMRRRAIRRDLRIETVLRNLVYIGTVLRNFCSLEISTHIRCTQIFNRPRTPIIVMTDIYTDYIRSSTCLGSYTQSQLPSTPVAILILTRLQLRAVYMVSGMLHDGVRHHTSTFINPPTT
jgi:hypothetical protein